MSSLPSSHKEALALGSDEFFTGKPCKYGHIANRRTANSHCVVCKKAANLHPSNAERANKWHDQKRHRADYRAYADLKNKIRAVAQAEKRFKDAKALQALFPDKDIYTREDARKAEKKYYFTGKTCSRGHLVERNTKSGQCVACEPFQMRTYYDAHKDELKAYSKERYEKMMETSRDERNARARAYHKTPEWKAYNREYQRKRRLDPAFRAQQSAYSRDWNRLHRKSRKKPALVPVGETINISLPQEITNG